MDQLLDCNGELLFGGLVKRIVKFNLSWRIGMRDDDLLLAMKNKITDIRIKVEGEPSQVAPNVSDEEMAKVFCQVNQFQCYVG